MAFLRVRKRSPNLVSVSLRFPQVAGNCIERTIPLLCEKKISLGCSRKIRDTVSSVQQCRAFIMWQLGVWLDFQRLVMAEVAAIVLINILIPSSEPENFVTYLSSWYLICQPPGVLMCLPSRLSTSLAMITMWSGL